MSIWGKILGGVGGFALGGPLGAIIGAVAGHAVDTMRAARPSNGDATKSIAFTIAVVVLGAKIAKSDGRVSREEIAAFKEVFHVPPAELRNVARVFDQARKDSRGFEPYAKQIAGMFQGNPAILEDLLYCLTFIARADGVLHSDEEQYLRAVSDIFRLDRSAFERVTEIRSGPDHADPYRVLGVARSIDDAALKAAYRTLVRENHPDRLTAQGMPEEFVELANKKLAAINVAYDKVSRERRMS
jgi:DnaJ like chaperone protein